MAIKNIIFDVGNVIVRWDPHHIVSIAFPEYPDHNQLARDIFKSETWLSLNKGVITDHEAIIRFSNQLGFDKPNLEQMLEIAKQSLTLIPGTKELIHNLKSQQKTLYALTDNTHEFMRHLKAQYDFWHLFNGIVVSAEEGHLKPSKEIYQVLLNRYQLVPHEAVFIDDIEPNVEGARAVGIHAIQFEDIHQCLKELEKLKII